MKKTENKKGKEQKYETTKNVIHTQTHTYTHPQKDQKQKPNNRYKQP